MRKFIGLAMMAASVVLVIVGAWLLLRPGSPRAETAANQPAVITPDLARLAIPQPATQAAPPTQVALAPTAASPTAAKPAAAQAEAKRISPADLQARLNGSNPPLVWELRSPTNYEKQHIPGSKLVTLNEVTALAQDLDRKQGIITNCD